MDFTLSKEHEMARSLFKEFAEKEVKPLAQEVDETEAFPRETVEKMAKLGFLGIPVPKEYGGQGCDPLTYAMCVEELSKVCGTTGVIVSAHTSLCCDPIMTYGTEEQKQKYLIPLAKGEKLGAFGLTEPGAGTDAQGQQTKAVLDGDEWVLNGSKCFITNGKEADVYVIFAITGTVEKRGRLTKEISAFIVEKGTPGNTRIIRADLHGLPYPEGESAWTAGQGLRYCHAYTGRRTYRYRFPGTGSGRRRIRDHHRLCKREKTVRQSYRRIPEYTVPAGRYGDQGTGCTAACLQGCYGEGYPEGLFRRSCYG